MCTHALYQLIHKFNVINFILKITRLMDNALLTESFVAICDMHLKFHNLFANLRTILGNK